MKTTNLLSIFLWMAWLLFFHGAAIAANVSSNTILLENVSYTMTDTDRPGVKKYVMEADFKGGKGAVCGVICDYYNLNTYMPKEFNSKVVKQEANQVTLDVTFNLPWPFKDLKSLLLIDFDKNKGTARWELIGGNIKENSGSILISQSGEYSHVKQVTFLDIGRYYPDWFINIYTRTLTYKIMRAIRDQIESRSAVFTKVKEKTPAKPTP